MERVKMDEELNDKLDFIIQQNTTIISTLKELNLKGDRSIVGLKSALDKLERL